MDGYNGDAISEAEINAGYDEQFEMFGEDSDWDDEPGDWDTYY